MKTNITLLLLAYSLNINASQQTTYPELTQYKELAESLLLQSQTAQSDLDLQKIKSETKELIVLGVKVMELYESKNPSCKKQYEVFYKEVESIENQTLLAAEERYHDGIGLPRAPTHCYFGRSQVIHPAMNLIRLKSAINDSIRLELIHDFDEVIEHLVRIQKNLDHPPGL